MVLPRLIQALLALSSAVLPTALAEPIPLAARSAAAVPAPVHHNGDDSEHKRLIRYDYGFDGAHRYIYKRQSSGLIVTRGASGGDNGTSPPLRLEVRQLQSNSPQWTLYLLALSMMQYTSQQDPSSWYQITGIHGIPFITWQGVDPVRGSEQTGYCTHMSILFPTWHRPYLALYEQILYSLVNRIANLYPTSVRAQYTRAALTFRIPYWDWAISGQPGDNVLPASVAGSPTVSVNGPNGLQNITNPLYVYEFKPLNASAFLIRPWNTWNRTLRGPSSQQPDAQSQMSRVVAALNSGQPNYRNRIYNLFSNYRNYTAFSNSAWGAQTGASSYDSIESLHDTLHVDCGQNGHMAYIPFSAFDPLFFLHHAMVDRLFAMWQVVNPNSWVTPMRAAVASYTTRQGDQQDSSSPLTPFFRDSSGTFWTSNAVRDHKIFGYTYADVTPPTSGPTSMNFRRWSSGMARGAVGVEARAELEGSTKVKTTTTTDPTAFVKKQINRLYGDQTVGQKRLAANRSNVDSGNSVPTKFTKVRSALGFGGLKQKASSSTTAVADKRSEPAPAIKNGISIDDVASRVVSSDGKYHEWMVNVAAPKQVFDETYVVYVFLGTPSSDKPADWRSDKAFVGTVNVFATPAGMPNQGNMMVSGSVPLTEKLLDSVGAGVVDSLAPEVAGVYIEKRVNLRIATASRKVKGVKDAKGLLATVVSAEVTAPKSDEELPTWSSTEEQFTVVAP